MGVQQQPTVVNKPKTTKPMSEARKIRKPLMERKRRERINTCLNDLASLLIDAKMVKAEPGKPTKLEKADILELTVKHIRSFKNPEKSTTTATSEADEKEKPTSSSYKEGFSKCMGMVDQTLGKAGKEALRQRLLTHLKSCLQSLEPPANKEATDAESPSKEAAETAEEAESRLTAPEATTVISNDTDDEKDEDTKVDPHTSETSAKEPPLTAPRLTLVPTRLPSGGVAFVIQGGLDPTMLLPQGDVSDVKDLPSETVSPPPSPVTCDSSTSSSPPASPPSLPDCSSAVSPPPPSSSSPSPCVPVTATTNQCPPTPSAPPSNNQDSTSDSADNQWSVRSSADHYPIPQTYHQVTSCVPSPVFQEGHCPSVVPYTTTTLYSTPPTPITAYCAPATTSQEPHASTQHHPHQVPTTSSYHIQSIPSFPQPIPPHHPDGFYHHSHNPPTPPPSISPQHVYHPHQYQHYQPVSSEEDMDTDGVSEEEVDIDVENDVPYDLSMRRIWRYW